MRYIPHDKMAKLREAARNGDTLAKKIIRAQLDDLDFSTDLDSYFAPKPEPELEEAPALPKHTKLEQFLADNNVKEDDPEYDSFVEDFRKENPEPEQELEVEKEEDDVLNKLIKEELEAIDSYSKAITKIMECEHLEEMQKRKIVSRLKEIRDDEEEHFSELRRLKKEISNIDEYEEEKPLEE